jgi:hypothetical protein
MAVHNFFAYPLDQPRLIREGVMPGERGISGADSHIALPTEHLERVRKGDKSMHAIPNLEPRPLSHSGQPFKDLKGGR